MGAEPGAASSHDAAPRAGGPALPSLYLPVSPPLPPIFPERRVARAPPGQSGDSHCAPPARRFSARL
eukprot:5947689-Alexandrium_andersonii.AAC.1